MNQKGKSSIAKICIITLKYMNETGTYAVTLEFWPQKLFYTGSTTSITTLTICTLYISKNKIKTIYKRYIKKRKSQSR